MAATGNEVVKLSQLKTWASANGFIESEISGQTSNATGDEVGRISQLRDLLETAGFVKPDEGEILTMVSVPPDPLMLSDDPTAFGKIEVLFNSCSVVIENPKLGSNNSVIEGNSLYNGNCVIGIAYMPSSYNDRWTVTLDSYSAKDPGDIVGVTGYAKLDEPLKLSQLKMVQKPLKIVSWADGTDEEIAAMVAAADAGRINLTDYWNKGDTRTVHLAAMSAVGVGESHVAQDVQFVLSDPGHYMLASGKPCNFVVLQKDCLKETGYMNAMNANTGGWSGCARRTWCNSLYRNAIPATFRPIFKQFTTYAANGTGSTFATSTDYFALFSEKEIFGSTTYANSSAESKNSQLTWFKTSSNRIKKVNGSANSWWERSPYSGYSNRFCFVTYSGNANWYYADLSFGLAPFGCI